MPVGDDMYRFDLAARDDDDDDDDDQAEDGDDDAADDDDDDQADDDDDDQADDDDDDQADDDDDDQADDDDDDQADDDDDDQADDDDAASPGGGGFSTDGRDERLADGPAEDSAYGRLGPSPTSYEFPRFAPSTRASALPDNLSYEYLFGPIENQGDTPACVTFATTAVIAALYHKHTGQSLAISKRALYSLAKHRFEPENLRQGGLYEESALRVFRDVGHVYEHDWPFGTPSLARLIEEVPPDIVRAARDLRTFQTVEADPEHMMAALHEHGPLVIGMPWHREWEDLDEDAVMTARFTDNHADGGHCTAIVGYSKKRNAFRLRNSWGTDWGDNGYAWLPMDHGIAIDDVYVVSV